MEIEPEISNINVLVVDDVPLNQLLMRTVLEDYGFSCDIAGNGKIAIEMMKANTYDIILMDLQIPEINGFEATNYIRKTLMSTIPIIAIMADVNTVDLGKCNAIGMDEYMSKPVDDNLLYRKIVGLVKKNKLIKIKKVIQKKQLSEELCTDLTYLGLITKSDPKLMKEMILLYLEQTPPLVQTMKTSYLLKDWQRLNKSVHKMIPSFSIMGISSEYEKMAKKIQDYTGRQGLQDGILSLIEQMEDVCNQSYEELKIELEKLNISNSEK
jgi:CheY-like chemotaxis protein